MRSPTAKNKYRATVKLQASQVKLEVAAEKGVIKHGFEVNRVLAEPAATQSEM